jgi:hypothetical protein
MLSNVFMVAQTLMLLLCMQAPAAAADDAHDLSAPLLAARAQERLQHHPENDHEVDHEVSGSGVKFILKEGLMLCIPTGFDLAATTLMNVGLLYVAASGKIKAENGTGWSRQRNRCHM